MKKAIIGICLLLFILVGCSSSKIDFSIETAPKYKEGESYSMIIEATEKEDKVTALEIVATLEMSKMDHGLIEVKFTDTGDGTYVGEVELPMAGEWIADINAKKDGKTYEQTIEFDAKEG